MAANVPDSTADALAGLGREMEYVRTELKALRQDLEDGLDGRAAASEVERLARVVTELADTVAPPDDESGDETVPGWLNAPAASGTTRGLLGALVEWVGTVYLRYADADRTLPACWLWHPDIVEELCWLMSAWHAAYTSQRPSVRAAGDWHDRLRPGVVRRIADYAKACSLQNHLPGGKATGDAPTAPAADAAEAIALWWADHRQDRPPAPTEDQIATVEAAAAAARRARGGGAR